MNRRSFFGLLAAAPVALKAAPAVMTSICVTVPATVTQQGISIRYIRDWDNFDPRRESLEPGYLSLDEFSDRYIKPWAEAQDKAFEDMLSRSYKAAGLMA